MDRARRATGAPPSSHRKLVAWVGSFAALCQPDHVRWCTGSAQEYDELCAVLVRHGTFTRIPRPNAPTATGPARTPGDVARVEDRTFICSADPADAGPTNNWRDPAEMRAEMTEPVRGVDAGPHDVRGAVLDGAARLHIAHIGVELTDSAYVACRLRIMARMGDRALEALGEDGEFVPCLHSVGVPLAPGQTDVAWPCDPDNKYVAHFPETREIWSYGSGYGGNALLGKKCFSLRIASVMARDEGWLAEHMLIVKLTSPAGEISYVTGAFPSACGKTNLAMLIPTLPGWKVETVGDDICWMKFGPDGRL